MEYSPTTGQGFGGRLAPIDQLEHLVADVESFLGDWLRRLEQLQAVSPTPDALLSNRMRELELEKSQWEAKRKRETQDIHAKAEELTKAWLRLEEEQRRFLQIRDARANGNRVPAVDNQSPREPVVETEPASSHPSSLPRTPATTAADESGIRRPGPLQGPRAGASAVRQFELLRREIQSSRHQHRRV